MMQTSQDDDTCAQRLRTTNNVCILMEQFSYRARKFRLPPCRVYFNFTFFIHDPVPNDSNELSVRSHTGVTVTAETSVVSVIDFHPTKTHPEGGNYYANRF